MRKSRRNFLGKFALSIAALLPWNRKSITAEPKNKKSMNSSNQEPILAIKPLGFQWETADPFLFCVHHDDKFPKGEVHLGPPAADLKGRHIGQDFILKDGWRMYHGKTVPGFPGHRTEALKPLLWFARELSIMPIRWEGQDVTEKAMFNG